MNGGSYMWVTTTTSTLQHHLLEYWAYRIFCWSTYWNCCIENWIEAYTFVCWIKDLQDPCHKILYPTILCYFSSLTVFVWFWLIAFLTLCHKKLCFWILFYFYRFSLLIFFLCVNFFSTKINHVLYLSTINLGIFFGSNKFFSLSHKI